MGFLWGLLMWFGFHFALNLCLSFSTKYKKNNEGIDLFVAIGAGVACAGVTIFAFTYLDKEIALIIGGAIGFLTGGLHFYANVKSGELQKAILQQRKVTNEDIEKTVEAFRSILANDDFSKQNKIRNTLYDKDFDEQNIVNVEVQLEKLPQIFFGDIDGKITQAIENENSKYIQEVYELIHQEAVEENDEDCENALLNVDFVNDEEEGWQLAFLECLAEKQNDCFYIILALSSDSKTKRYLVAMRTSNKTNQFGYGVGEFGEVNPDTSNIQYGETSTNYFYVVDSMKLALSKPNPKAKKVSAITSAPTKKTVNKITKIQDDDEEDDNHNGYYFSIDDFGRYILNTYDAVEKDKIYYFQKSIETVMNLEKVRFEQLIANFQTIAKKYYFGGEKQDIGKSLQLCLALDFFSGYLSEKASRRISLSGFKNFLVKEAKDNVIFNKNKLDKGESILSAVAEKGKHIIKEKATQAKVNKYVEVLQEVLNREKKTLYWLTQNISSTGVNDNSDPDSDDYTDVDEWYKNTFDGRNDIYEQPSLDNVIEWFWNYCEWTKENIDFSNTSNSNNEVIDKNRQSIVKTGNSDNQKNNLIIRKIIRKTDIKGLLDIIGLDEYEIDDDYLFVAVFNGKVVGLIQGELNSKNEGVILAHMVDTCMSNKNMRVAEKLLKTLENEFYKIGVNKTTMKLDTRFFQPVG